MAKENETVVETVETKKTKKEKKDRTYSISGIMSEMKQVEWPGFKGLMSTSGLVIGFTLLFGLYFFICELAASGLVNAIIGLK
ncbi:MAG: preprotein translocase subunit SecE [Bacillota bacterium]|nr:preprotein translocase subunit SecE [Bacillota bacterium]